MNGTTMENNGQAFDRRRVARHLPCMNIEAAPGTVVMFANPENGTNWDREHAIKFLVPGCLYTVEATRVENWHTAVTLREVPDQTFNSVHFIDWPDPERAVGAARASLTELGNWYGLLRDPLEQYEALSEEYRAETGYLRPGKDNPLDTREYEECNREWKKWVTKRLEEMTARLVSALALLGATP